jgi:hypothetical protein
MRPSTTLHFFAASVARVNSSPHLPSDVPCLPFQRRSSSSSCRTVCLRLRFRSLMKKCPNSPAADRPMPVRNAGTSTMMTCSPARSRSAAAIRMTRIHGSGAAVSIQAPIRRTSGRNRRQLRGGPRRFRGSMAGFFGETNRLTFWRGVTSKIGPLENMRCGKPAKNCPRRNQLP